MILTFYTIKGNIERKIAQKCITEFQNNIIKKNKKSSILKNNFYAYIIVNYLTMIVITMAK